MKDKHRRTLELIFSRPTPAGVKWNDVVGLFGELALSLLNGKAHALVSFFLNK